MTRKEAISLLTQVNKILVNSNSWLENTHEPLNTAFDMAIKALEQQPCEDCISRKAVLSEIKEVCFSEEWLRFRVDYGSNGQRDFLINYIEQLPSVTPQHCEDWKFYYDHGYAQAKRDLFCEDCISRAEALRHSHIEYDDDGEGHRVVYAEDIEDLQSVTPGQIKGRWLKVFDDTGRTRKYHFRCSICGNDSSGWGEYNYCPICGAEMKEVEGCR